MTPLGWITVLLVATLLLGMFRGILAIIERAYWAGVEEARLEKYVERNIDMPIE